MPRRCTVCTHPQRAEIERALTDGGTIRDIARRFRVSRPSLARHKAHMREAVKAALEAGKVNRGRDVLERLQELDQRTRAILEQAQREGRARDALAAIRELRGLLKLEAELVGDLGRGTVVNVVPLVHSPEWHQLRDILISTLEAYPEAKQAVANAISRVLKN